MADPDDPPFVIEDDVPQPGDEDDLRAAVATSHREAEHMLSTRHIRAITLERRAIYRSRTWVIVAAFVLFGGAGQAAYLAIGDARQGSGLRAAAFAVLAGGMIACGVWFARKIKPLTAEANALKMPEPQTPPDFSTLSNGQQFAEALERMTEQHDDAQPLPHTTHKQP